MSGPFGAGGLQLFGAGGFYPYSIDQSLRFEDGDSPYLQRTSADGDTRTWTVSFWTKLCSDDTYQYFLRTEILGSCHKHHIPWTSKKGKWNSNWCSREPAS